MKLEAGMNPSNPARKGGILVRRSVGRQGVTLLEIAIVVAIIGILAAVGATYLTPLLPSWRTRRAAYEFASHVEMARQLAGTDANPYRVHVELVDSDVDAGTPSIGGYTISSQNPEGSAVQWDILPLDDGDGDATQGEGVINFSEGAGSGALPGASLMPPGTGGRPTDSALVFDKRGFLMNSDGDFGGAGTIDFVFVNKRARATGTDDIWTVCVNRTGMVRVSSNRNPGCMSSSSIMSTSSGNTSAGTGHQDDGASGWGTSTTIPTGSSGGGATPL